MQRCLYEDKQIDRGEKVTDSGGTTLFLGPALTVKANDNVSVFGNVLFPVHQNLGGVHQEIGRASCRERVYVLV